MIPFRPMSFTPMDAADWFLLGVIVTVLLVAICWLLADWRRTRK